MRTLGPRILSIRLFYNPSRTAYSMSPQYRHMQSLTHPRSVQDCQEQLFQGLSEPPPITLIPCRHIASRDYDDWDYAMFIVGS